MKKISGILLAAVLLLTACGRSGSAQIAEGPSWQEQYDLGIRYLSEGNYQEGIIALTAAIEIDRQRPDAYRALGGIYMEQGDYEAAAAILEQGAANTGDESLRLLQQDAQKYAAIDYEHLVTDAYTFTGQYSFGEFEYHIPRINLDYPAIEQVNNKIYEDIKYEQLEDELREYEYADHCARYEWAVNQDILSLIVWEDAVRMFWADVFVYNVSLLTGEQVSDEDVIARAGITMDEYYLKVEQALGSSFVGNGADNMFRVNDMMRETYNDQLKNTISPENVRSARPFFNSEGQLCVVAAVYALAGPAYHMDVLNLEDFELVPNYKDGI